MKSVYKSNSGLTVPDMGNKTAHIMVRVEEVTKRALQKEADAKGLDLATYVRQLIFTHQDRQGKGGK